MTVWTAIRTLIIGVIFLAPISAVYATSVHVTDASWDEGSAPYASTLSNTIDGIDVTATAGGPGGTDPKLIQDGIAAVPVPIPAAFWMFGTALIGFVAMSRRTKV
jgi:hypothetical protein